jgi:hypothetical protein
VTDSRGSWAQHWLSLADDLRATGARYRADSETADEYERMAEAAERMAEREQQGEAA